MRCSRYRPISKGATGRPPIYPTGFLPKEFNQIDLPYGHHTRRQSRLKRGPPPAMPHGSELRSDRSRGYAAGLAMPIGELSRGYAATLAQRQCRSTLQCPPCCKAR